MNILPIEDQHCLRAALGWLELGNPLEAQGELDAVSKGAQDHWEVLMVRWCVLAELKEWERALVVARKQLQLSPDKVDGWIHQAYALRRVPGGGIEKAQEALLHAANLFPEEELIAYNLSCYAAQLGFQESAWDWFNKAVKLGGKLETIKKRALEDDDLKPLWDKIRELGKTA